MPDGNGRPKSVAGWRYGSKNVGPPPPAAPGGRLAEGPCRCRGPRVAVLVGAEGPGLSDATLAAADERVGIPMRGGADSLNVGVAAGIACWVLGRR